MVSVKEDERLVTMKICKTICLRLTTLKYSNKIAIDIDHYEKNIETEIGYYEKKNNQATFIKS